MALIDLLWACPLCGERSGWRMARGAACCGGCGVRFRRGANGMIEAKGPHGIESASATDWARRLPPIEPPTGRSGTPGHDSVPVVRSRARMSVVQSMERVRYARRFVGSFERMGPSQDGVFSLSADAMSFAPDEEHGTAAGQGEGAAGQDGGEQGGGTLRWPLDRVAAVQASSRSLQFKPRHEKMVSVQFQDSSCRYWQELVMAALRRLYQERGWGEIVEFQPRIETA